jgi:RHS repeat-associated protein
MGLGQTFAASELGWYDYGFRMYDPQLARFHTLDPLAEYFPHQSPYVYANNNPVRFIDFMGLSAEETNGDDEDEDDKTKRSKEQEQSAKAKRDNGEDVDATVRRFRAMGVNVKVYSNPLTHYLSEKAGRMDRVASNGGFSNYFFASSSAFNLVNTIYGLNNDFNLSEISSRAKGWESVTGKVTKSLRKELGFTELAKKITRSASKKALFLGAVYSTYDVTNNPSLDNFAWNTLDVSVSALGLLSGYATIPSLLYFSGRIGSEIYESTKPQEPLVFQSEGWKNLNKKP